MVSLKSSFIRFLGALLVAAGVLMAVTACQERQRASDRAGGTPPDVTQSTPTATSESLQSDATQPTPTDTPKSAQSEASQPTPTSTPKSPQSDAAQSTPTATPKSPRTEGGMAVNRIAYTGSDGNIFTINPDGTDSRRLTTTDLRVGSSGGNILAQGLESRVFYSWPTWSPDGTKLAASRTVLDEAQAQFSVEVIDVPSGRTTRVYDNEPNTFPITQGAPHYLYWSPDSEHLTFIASTPGELALYLTSSKSEWAPVYVAGQGPLYFSWARDSSAILIHRRGDILFTVRSGGGLELPRQLIQTNLLFNAPALYQDGSKMVYAATSGDGNAIYVAETEPQVLGAEPILEVGEASAFLWSPTRDEVAVADTSARTWPPIFERLTVISSDGTTQRTLVNEEFVSFFWSPDGDQVAYVAYDAYDATRRPLTWKFVDRAGQRPTELVDFLPSPEFLTLLLFFDQYSYSTSVWSPDSSQITFSGMLGTELSQNGTTPEAFKVFVMDLKEGTVPREIASSRFASWSWK